MEPLAITTWGGSTLGRLPDDELIRMLSFLSCLHVEVLQETWKCAKYLPVESFHKTCKYAKYLAGLARQMPPSKALHVVVCDSLTYGKGPVALLPRYEEQTGSVAPPRYLFFGLVSLNTDHCEEILKKIFSTEQSQFEKIQLSFCFSQEAERDVQGNIEAGRFRVAASYVFESLHQQRSLTTTLNASGRSQSFVRHNAVCERTLYYDPSSSIVD